MCNAAREKTEMEEIVEEIKDLLDEIVDEARERLKDKKPCCDSDQEREEVEKKTETKVYFELNLSKLPNDQYDKKAIRGIIEKAIPEAIAQIVSKTIRDCRK